MSESRRKRAAPKRNSLHGLTLSQPKLLFVCNICGIEATEAILCTNKECLTDVLVLGVSTITKH